MCQENRAKSSPSSHANKQSMVLGLQKENPQKYAKLILRTCGFHIAQNFLRAIGIYTGSKHPQGIQRWAFHCMSNRRLFQWCLDRHGTRENLQLWCKDKTFHWFSFFSNIRICCFSVLYHCKINVFRFCSVVVSNVPANRLLSFDLYCLYRVMGQKATFHNVDNIVFN